MFESDSDSSFDSDLNSSPKRVKRRLFASYQRASKRIAIDMEKSVSKHKLAS